MSNEALSTDDNVKVSPKKKRSAREWIDLFVYLYKAIRGHGHIRLASVLVYCATTLLIGPPVVILIIMFLFGLGAEALGDPFGAGVWGYAPPIFSLLMLTAAVLIYFNGEQNAYRKMGQGGVVFTTQSGVSFSFAVKRLCKNKNLVAKFVGFTDEEKAIHLETQEFSAPTLSKAIKHLGDLALLDNFPQYEVTETLPIIVLTVEKGEALK